MSEVKQTERQAQATDARGDCRCNPCSCRDCKC
jgi:hypothetical protein